MNTPPLNNYGTFAPLASITSIRQYKPFTDKPKIIHQPKRKLLEAPIDDGTFILPMKQSFMKNPRLGNGTKIMLSILMGLNGAGGCLRTTTGSIGKLMNRSRRMTFNYLQEALQEGYLSYSKIKDRMGYYIGIKIYLNRHAIIKSKPQTKNENHSVSKPERDVKYIAEINKNLINNSYKDEELMTRLTKFALSIGYIKADSIKLPDKTIETC